jgi:hypothetical protein
MGSAVCFPVEAMVFSAIVLIGIERQLRRHLSRSELLALPGRVRVYGDDIIVPEDYALSVTGALEDFGLKVNHRKSFWTGRFRESCGKEFYDGHDVSVVRCRRSLPSSRRDVHEVASAVSLRNQLYRAGYWGAAAWLDDRIRAIGPFPVVAPSSKILGRESFLPIQADRLSKDTHRPLVRGMWLRGDPPASPLDGVGALLKFFLKRGDTPSEEGHLARTGRPRSVHIKTGWAAAD